MKTGFGVIMGLLLILRSASGLFGDQNTTNIVATVNGEPISREHFLNVLQSRYGERVLRDLIANYAIRQAAKAAGVVVTKEELERRFQSIQATHDARAIYTGETFAMWLAKQGITPEAFVANLYDQMLLEKMVESNVKITDEEVARWYETNKNVLTEPAQVRIAHILVKTAEEAQALRAQIVSGKISWNEAASKSSLDARTRENGGDIGFVPQGDSEFQKAAFALKAQNEISQPVASPLGWHLLKRIGYKAARTPPFEEVEASIRDMLRRSQLASLTIAKRNEILKAAKVEIKVEFTPEGPPPFPVADSAPVSAPSPR